MHGLGCAPVKTGLLLFAHGSRNPHWAQPFEDIAARIAERAPEVAVALAYLELMSPGIAEAGGNLAQKGCTRIDVLPLFLATGGHVRDDLPALVDALRVAHARVQWRLHPPIGEIESVVQAMADAAIHLLGNNPRA